MLTFCKLNMAVLYNILVKFIVFFFFFLIFVFIVIITVFLFFFKFPGISSRYMTGDFKFCVFTGVNV